MTSPRPRRASPAGQNRGRTLPCARGVERVQHQVHRDLTEPLLVAGDVGDVRRDARLERDLARSASPSEQVRAPGQQPRRCRRASRRTRAGARTGGNPRGCGRAADLVTHEVQRLDERVLLLLRQLLQPALEHRQLKRGGVERVAESRGRGPPSSSRRRRASRASARAAELRLLLVEAHLPHGLLDRDEELLGRARLHEVGARARADRGHGRLQRGEPGEEHHLALGRQLLQLRARVVPSPSGSFRSTSATSKPSFAPASASAQVLKPRGRVPAPRPGSPRGSRPGPGCRRR